MHQLYKLLIATLQQHLKCDNGRYSTFHRRLSFYCDNGRYSFAHFIEDYFFPSSDETVLETMISPYSTINMIEKLDSSNSSLPVSVPASVTFSDIQTPSTTNPPPTVYELQPQISK